MLKQGAEKKLGRQGVKKKRRMREKPQNHTKTLKPLTLSFSSQVASPDLCKRKPGAATLPSHPTKTFPLHTNLPSPPHRCRPHRLSFPFYHFSISHRLATHPTFPLLAYPRFLFALPVVPTITRSSLTSNRKPHHNSTSPRTDLHLVPFIFHLQRPWMTFRRTTEPLSHPVVAVSPLGRFPPSPIVVCVDMLPATTASYTIFNHQNNNKQWWH